MEQFQWPATFSAPETLERLHLFVPAEKDLSELLAIERVSFAQPWTAELFRLEFTSPVTLSVGARWGGERGFLVGYLFLWLVLDEVQVHTIAVHPAMRGQKIAPCLLAIGFELARQKGGTWSSLEVRPSNHAARRLYGNLGFKEVGRRPNYYNSPKEDALLLNVSL